MRRAPWTVTATLLAGCFSDAGPGQTAADTTAPAATTTTTTDATTGDAPTTAGTTDAPGDTSSDDTGPPPPLGLCGLPHGGWTVGKVEQLPLSTADIDLDPVLQPDGRTLAFSDATKTFLAERPGPGEPFGPAVGVESVGLASMGLLVRVQLSADGRTAWLGSDAGGAGGMDVWQATRDDPGDAFGALVNLTTVNTEGDDFDHLVTADGLRMYLAPRPAMGRQRLVLATRDSLAEPFSAPGELPELASDFDDGAPALPADERTIVFASKRSGAGDLYVAVRDDRELPFDAPVALAALNTDDFEGEPFLSADGCELFFASDRPGGEGHFDLYRATIVPLP